MIRKSSTFRLLAAVMTTWMVAGIPATAQAGAGRPDLTGQWQFNRRLSDDVQSKFGSMGGGGGHHGGGGGPFEEIRNSMLNAPTRLVLTQDDQKVVLTESNGRVRTLPTNNRVAKIDGRDVRTRWENNRLVSETTISGANLVDE